MTTQTAVAGYILNVAGDSGASPWCDIKRAAEELQDKYIYSWKPNPAMLVGQFSPEAIRSYLRDMLDTTRDCRVEIILKDTFTLEGHPERLQQFLSIARQEIDRTQ